MTVSKSTTETMEMLARAVDHILNADNKHPRDHVCFSLLVWNMRDEGLIGQGRVNYISNSNRETVLSAMKEMVARWTAAANDDQVIISGE
jgi:hypothetical protein